MSSVNERTIIVDNGKYLELMRSWTDNGKGLGKFAPVFRREAEDYFSLL
jgi:hypothetical protein